MKLSTKFIKSIQKQKLKNMLNIILLKPNSWNNKYSLVRLGGKGDIKSQ